MVWATGGKLLVVCGNIGKGVLFVGTRSVNADSWNFARLKASFKVGGFNSFMTYLISFFSPLIKFKAKYSFV